uniref:Uncharacterized protein n=1 Tax=Schistocephalus solidus TaxID=70667 RepID=A0A0X3Q1I5_SCHSO
MDATSLSTPVTSAESSTEMNEGGVRIHRIQYRCAEGRSSTSTLLNHSTRVTVPTSPSPDQKLTAASQRVSSFGTSNFNTAVSEKTDALHSSESVNSLSSYASTGVESTGVGEMRRLMHYVKASGKQQQQQQQRHTLRKDFNISTDSESQMTNSFDSSEMSACGSLVRVGTASEQNRPATVESEFSRQMAILRKSQSSVRTVMNVEDRFKHSATIYSESMIHSIEEQCQALEECLRLLPSARELTDYEGNTATAKPNARDEEIGVLDFLKTMDLPVSFLVDLIRPNFGPTDELISADEGESSKAGEGGGEAAAAAAPRSVSAAYGGGTTEITAANEEQGQTIRMRFKAINRRRNLGSARLFRKIISFSDLDHVIKTSLPALENIQNAEDEQKSKNSASQRKNCRKDLLRNLIETVVEQSRSAKKDADLSREYIAILESLSKQAEDVCQSVIYSGGLESLLYACRSEDPEILKHAVFALANLTIHGGESSQIQLVKQHAVEWLFPIALHNDELLRYYAFLTLLLLLVNKELMPTVANSELLSFFVPFVNSHNPVEFTKESQLEPIIFSSEWMSRLLPALTVGRREAQALAAFHFVAAITAMGNSLQKLCPDTKEQNQLCHTLQELAETENLPTSVLASQALSLLGIPIPKCLSMQVCRWTVEEVVFWMSRVCAILMFHFPYNCFQNSVFRVYFDYQQNLEIFLNV